MANLEDRLTLAAFNAATEDRGNVKLVWGEYVGTGEAGQTNPTTLTFEGQPLLVHIYQKTNCDYAADLYYGTPYGKYVFNAGITLKVTWNDKSVSMYVTQSDRPDAQFNTAQIGYVYFALIEV